MARQLEETYQLLERRATSHGRSLPLTRNDYVSHLVSNYVALYQSRAIIGLKAIGTVPALRALATALDRAQSGASVYRPDVLQELGTGMPSVTISAGDGASAPMGTTLSVAPAVRVTDGFGTPSAGWPVTFAVIAGGGSVTGAAQTTDSQGVATVGSWTLGAPGPNRLRAAVTGLSDVTFGAIGTLSVLSVDAGALHTCLVALGSAAYCWGQNGSGQLGDATITPRVKPARVHSTPPKFVAVSAGVEHTCGLWTSGAALCWGRNSAGALGDNTLETRTTPVPVHGGLTFASVSAGGGHTCGVTTGGAAYCWGFNFHGQLGDNSTMQRLTPVPVSGGLSFATVTAGGSHTCGITTAGAAYCWGRNFDGELGDSTTIARTVPEPVRGGLVFATISAGGFHTCGVTTVGVAYCWGRNESGQLGDGSTTERWTPRHVDAVDDPLSDVRSFKATLSGTQEVPAVPTTASGSATCLPTGTAFSCTVTYSGLSGPPTAAHIHIGTPGTTGAVRVNLCGAATAPACPASISGTIVSSPQPASGASYTAVAAAMTAHDTYINVHTAANSNGEIRGQLVSVARRFASLAASHASTPPFTSWTCGITPAGAAYCWGRNDTHQLGDGTTTQRLKPVPVFGALIFAGVSAGSGHTCGVTTSREAYCWGRNNRGELGDGTVLPRTPPTRVAEP